VSVMGVTTKGTLDRDTIDASTGLGGTVLATEIRVTIESGSLPGLAIGVALGVDGQTYTVRDIDATDDGGVTVVRCTTVFTP